jgi:hypothetical protein
MLLGLGLSLGLGTAHAQGGGTRCDYEATITALPGKPAAPRDEVFDLPVQVRIGTAQGSCSYRAGELVEARSRCSGPTGASG